MVNNFKKLIKSFNKLPVLCKIAGILVIAIIVKLVMYCLTKNIETMSNPKELIYFYWDKCGHCKDFTPIWDEFSAKYKGPLKLKKIETKDAGELTKKFNIQGYPTVILVNEQGQHKEFDGERTVQGLEVFTK